jgi:hypothetical protein
MWALLVAFRMMPIDDKSDAALFFWKIEAQNPKPRRKIVGVACCTDKVRIELYSL